MGCGLKVTVPFNPHRERENLELASTPLSVGRGGKGLKGLKGLKGTVTFNAPRTCANALLVAIKVTVPFNPFTPLPQDRRRFLTRM